MPYKQKQYFGNCFAGLRIAVKYMASLLMPSVYGLYVLMKQVQARGKIRRLLAREGDLFVEFGAGDKKGSGFWVTVDMSKYSDLFWDLRNGIPFPDNSVSKIYSSHFLEHLSFREGQCFLRECVRVLKPGGVFSISVPNAKVYIEAYMSGAALDECKYFAYKSAFNNTTHIDYVNHIAYMDGHHKYMFDGDNLVYILESAGFCGAHLRGYDQSIDPSERQFASLYADAKKI